MTLQDAIVKAKSELQRYKYLSAENPSNGTYARMVLYWANTLDALERMA